MNTNTAGLWRTRAACLGASAIIACAASAAALGDDDVEKQETSTANHAAGTTQRAAEQAGQAEMVVTPVDAALQPAAQAESADWSPVGHWSGQYRPPGGTDSRIEYRVCDDSNIDVQLHLKPLARNRYTVTNARFELLAATFSLEGLESRADCKLKRRSENGAYVGKCYNADGQLEVARITMTSQEPLDAPGCED